MVMDALMPRAAGATDADLTEARRRQRRAQFLLDFIEAENSMGFHADQEAVRVLALSLGETRRGQAALPGTKATGGPQTDLKPAAPPASPATSPP
jgi:nitrite reductase (cytochrome c-552)